MIGTNLFGRIFLTKEKFIEIVDTNSESDLQFILDLSKKKQLKIKSIFPFYEPQSLLEDFYDG